MADNKETNETADTAKQSSTPNENSKQVVEEAHTQAEKDIEDDGELLPSDNPIDDLDEEESARLGEDTPTPII